MKPLPKHLRPRYRYIVVSIESWPTAQLDKRTFQHAIWASTSRLFGDIGATTADLFLIRFEFSNGSGWGIIRTRRDALPIARSSIACISKINEFSVGIIVRGVSGTIKSCEDKYLSEPSEPVISGEHLFNTKMSPSFTRGNCIDIQTDTDFIGATHLDVT
mgnify:CR=1 FL=1